jgi:hypothetical protein
MKPWALKLNDRADDNFTVPLWEHYKPKDFYFATQWEEDVKSTIVYIVPADYFDVSGKMFSDSMPIVQYLPSYMEEVSECEYECKVPILNVQHDLLMIGFTHNQSFQRYIDKHGKYGF